MEVRLPSWGIKLGLDSLVDIGEEPNPVIIQGKLRKFIVLLCSFQQFQQPSRVMPVIFILNLPVVEVEVLAVHGCQLVGQLPLPLS